MKHSDNMELVSAALVRVQAEIKPVGKDATNPHFKSKFASLDAITAAVKPALQKHGLAVVQGTVPTTDETGSLTTLVVETMLIHLSGQWISNGVAIPLDKATAQGAGSAVTYGRRYGLAALLAITNDEDDDGARASERSEAKAADIKSSPAPREGVAPEQTGGPIRSAADKLMPFGKTKGKRLGDLHDEELEQAIAWCRKTDAKKFESLIAALEEVLASRSVGVGATNFDDYPGALEDTDDDSLPF